MILDLDTGRAPWSLYGAVSQLKAFDDIDLTPGLQEVRRYLTAKYEGRFDLHPRLFELTVASVFRDMGYSAEATAYSADGGVDVILRDSEGRTTAVQVKRVKAPIEVEQVRAFAGAMILGGYTKGLFVTTSRFRKGSRIAADRLSELAMPIELIDAPKLLDALRITQRPLYRDYDEWYDRYGEPELATIYEDCTDYR